MSRWYNICGVLFLAVMSVYYSQALPANSALAASDAVLAQAATSDKPDPFASGATTQAVDLKPVGPPPKITLSDAGTFSIQINNDVSLVEVLRMIGSQAQLSIIPSKEVRGTVPAMDLYNVNTHDALDAILHSNGFAWEQKGNIVYVYSQDEMDKRKKKDLETDVYRLYYVAAADAEALLKPHLSAEGIVSVTPAASLTISGGGAGGSSAGSSSGGSSAGGGSGSSSDGNSYANVDVLIITDHPQVQDKIREIIKQIDRRPKQVLVEATILEAELSENNSLGINFTALGSVNFTDLGVLDATGAPSIINLAGGSGSSGSSSGSGSSGSSGSGSSGLTGLPGANVKGGFNTVQTGQGGLQVGIIQDNIAIFLKALESVTNTTILSNPKVLTLDKQEGEVHIGETIYYEGTNTATATTNTVSVSSLDTGITLDFRPYVGDDGYIRLQVHPSDSTPNGQATQANGLPPNINANEVNANIMVKDGRTVVIGGLFSDNNSTNKAQVPFFGNLPLAGPLFRQQADSSDRKEIIFLLTPHIIKDDEVFSQLSEKELTEMERLRVGVRQGMMPWGRERLAETCYEAAETELHKPHPDLAVVRWHLDCATNLNPNFLEAITLKEKITGVVLTTSDNSSIRGLVRRQMLAELGSASLDVPPKLVVISSTMNPTTQPALEPATHPSAAIDLPTFIAPLAAIPLLAPATQPSLALAPESPSTQPSVAVAPDAPATQPSAALAETPATQPSDSSPKVITSTDNNEISK